MKLIRLLPILLVIGLSCLTSCQKENVSFGLIAILSIVVAANFRLCTLFL